MENKKEEIAIKIAHNLLQIKAIKLNPANPFTWASGIKSPIYCDNRIVLSYPPVRKAVIEAMVCLLYTSPSAPDRTRCRMPSSA